MSLKTWMLSSMNRVFARADLPPRAPVPHPAGEARVEPMLRAPGARGLGGTPEHLGRYGPLIAAVREELEEFVASQLRLHLAIAERDRYVLTSIDVDDTGSEDARELLQRFTREFTPEQVKHYLAKQVIARLPNANAIDLSQFAGINVNQANDSDEDAYVELMNELRGPAQSKDARSYQVTLVGRWSEADATSAREATRRLESPLTPPAGRDLAIDIDDADGRRRIDLGVVVPGRRYVVGKDESCDVVVKGVYASRRHCEIWLERGSWWVTDCGSTNGIRVEPPFADSGQSSRADAATTGDASVLAVVPGARIVLSAVSQGSAREYPRLELRAAASASTGAHAMSPSTPVTPIVPPSRAPSGLTLTARMASGVRTIDLPAGGAPVRVGRSRNQSLVIDWAHQDVSGHHIDIVERDPSGAAVIVHGDNGVIVDGTAHAPGARFHWEVGQTMILGGALHREAGCSLTLSRPA